MKLGKMFKAPLHTLAKMFKGDLKELAMLSRAPLVVLGKLLKAGLAIWNCFQCLLPLAILIYFRAYSRSRYGFTSSARSRSPL